MTDYAENEKVVRDVLHLRQVGPLRELENALTALDAMTAEYEEAMTARDDARDVNRQLMKANSKWRVEAASLREQLWEGTGLLRWAGTCPDYCAPRESP